MHFTKKIDYTMWAWRKVLEEESINTEKISIHDPSMG